MIEQRRAELLRERAAQRLAERLEDLDWILDTEPSLCQRLALCVDGEPWSKEQRQVAREYVAGRLGITAPVFERWLRQNGRDVRTMRPAVDSLSPTG